MVNRLRGSEHTTVFVINGLKKTALTPKEAFFFIQGGAEPTGTFQIVIDNIWKQGKISETVYKYVRVCYLLPTDYKLIFRTSGRWPPFTSMHCCKHVWKLPYTRLRRSSSIAATLSTMARLSSWIVMIRLRNTRSFRNNHRKKIWYSKFGRQSRPSDVAETTNTGNTLLHVPTLHCDWPYEIVSSPLPFPLLPTTKSYCAGAIFKFEMCQSALRHPVKRDVCLFKGDTKLLWHVKLYGVLFYSTDFVVLSNETWLFLFPCHKMKLLGINLVSV